MPTSLQSRRRTEIGMSQLTLLCLPYAGGSAATYRGWQSKLPQWVTVKPVELPGHGTRRFEKSISDWDNLMRWLMQETSLSVDGAFAIIGHSMGALIGYELAQVLHQRGQPPVWFAASGCKAPSVRETELHWLSCPEEEILDELCELGGTPPELLQNRELLELVLPTVRGDFHLCGSYRYHQRTPLPCPIFVLSGTEDAEVSEPATNLQAWGKETGADCRIRLVRGDHFFVENRQTEVLTLISNELTALRAKKERSDA